MSLTCFADKKEQDVLQTGRSILIPAVIYTMGHIFIGRTEVRKAVCDTAEPKWQTLAEDSSRGLQVQTPCFTHFFTPVHRFQIVSKIK